MVVNFNGCGYINLDKVEHALIEGKTISFYLVSGASRHFVFDTEKAAKTAFENILCRLESVYCKTHGDNN